MLICTLKNIYGSKFDVNTYVRNYFDSIYNPIDIDWDKYMEIKINEFDMREMLCEENVLFLVSVFRKWDFTIREAEVCINNVIFFLCFYRERLRTDDLTKEAIMIYLYFLLLRYKYNPEYKKILRGEYILKNTRKTDYKKLNSVLNVNPNIESVLKDLANGKANDSTSDLIAKYHLLNIETITNFSQNIEWVLNYSI